MKVGELYATLGLKEDSSFKRGERAIDRVRAKMRELAAGRQRDEKGRFVAGTGRRGLGGLAQTLAGLGAGFAAMAAARDTFNFAESLVELDVASQSAMGKLEDVRSKILDVSSATGVSKEQVLQGAQAFVALTGDGKAAAASMEQLARVQKATNAEMNDIATTSARLQMNMGITAGQMEDAFSVIIAGGKAGSIEMKDLAGSVGKIAPMFSRFAGGAGMEGLREMVAIAETLGTALSPGETETAMTQMMAAITRNAKKLRAKGINIYDKDGELKNFLEIVDAINAKGFNATELGEILGNRQEAQRAFAIMKSARKNIDEVAKATEGARDVAEDYAKVQASWPAQARKAWAGFKNTVTEFFTFFAEHGRLTLVLLGSLAASFVILKAGAVAAALATAASWIIALAPFILIAAGIAAIILLIEDVYQWITGGESVLKRFWQHVKTYIGEGVLNIWETVTRVVREAWDDMITWAAEKLEWFLNKAKRVVQIISAPGDALGDAIFGSENNIAAARAAAGVDAAGRARRQARNAGSSTVNSSPTLNLNVNGGDPATVRQTVEDWWNSEVRGADEALAGAQ